MLEPEINRTEVHLADSLTIRFLQGSRDSSGCPGMPPDLPALPIFDASKLPGLSCCGGRTACSGLILVPLRPRECAILDITGRWWKPDGVKAVVGGLNALTGLQAEPEKGWEDGEYLVVGDTGGFRGLRMPDGSLRPFALGPGGSGLEIVLAVAEPKPGLFPDRPPRTRGPVVVDRNTWGAITLLGVRLVDPKTFRRLTGLQPPAELGRNLHRDAAPAPEGSSGDPAAMLPAGVRMARRRPNSHSSGRPMRPRPAVHGGG